MCVLSPLWAEQRRRTVPTPVVSTRTKRAHSRALCTWRRASAPPGLRANSSSAGVCASRVVLRVQEATAGEGSCRPTLDSDCRPLMAVEME